MAGQHCHNCIYSVCDPELWLRLMWAGEPILPRCANHPQWPGQLREVPGVACRNYRRKPKMPSGDDVRLIPLTDGLYAYVDAADYEWLSRWRWHTTSGGYPARAGKGKQIFMHREIIQPPEGKLVDHQDGNEANNCRFNLRLCSHKENRGNMRKQMGTYSRFKGVSYNKRRDKCFAQCDFGGEHRWLGFFDDEVEVARAYDYAAVQECGEFAYVNFPQEWPPERRREVYAAYQAALKKERRKSTHKTKSKHARRGEASAARERKKIRRKERKKDTPKATHTRKPRRARRKKNKSPRKPRTE